MIITLTLHTIAFVALFLTSLGWELKLFLAAALAAIHAHFLLADFQADMFFERQHRLSICLSKSLENHITNQEFTGSIDQDIERLIKGMQMDDMAGGRENITLLTILSSLATPILLAWLISTFAIPFVITK